MCAEDVEALDHVDEWGRLVLLPLLHILGATNDDNEVVILSLEVDFGLHAVCASHLGCVCGGRLSAWFGVWW